MSSEIRLATSYSDFWNELLPMGDAFIRAQNSKAHTFTTSVMADTAPDLRGIVNEAGFLLFKHSLLSPAEFASDGDRYIKAFNESLRRNERLPRARRPNFDPNSTSAWLEARAIARNLDRHFAEEHSFIQINPPIPGCGWVGDVEADILCGTTLYEVKAGDRHFRLTDLRQLLIYCALNFSSKTYDIRDVALINPRSGMLVRESLDGLCRQTSGASAVRILSDIVSFVSEPTSTYSMT